VDFFLVDRKEHMMKQEHVKRRLSAVESQKQKSDYVIWDDEVAGLGKRVRATKSVWLCQSRVDGKTKRKTLGDCQTIKLEQARAMATAWLDQFIDRAEDELAGVTLEHFVERYLNDCKGRWKPATLSGHRYGLQRFLPALGQKEVSAITREDVLAARLSLDAAEGTINRGIAALSDLMRHAELLGLRRDGSNPCLGLRKHSSEFEAIYLSEDQYRAFGDGLRAREADMPLAVAYIRFLALTGCRRSEAMSLEWGWIDGSRIALPDAKSGPKTIWAGKPVRDLLKALPRDDLHVFSQNGRRVTIHDLNKIWKPIREEMGLPNLRLHDLRHSLASTAINRGLSMELISGLLGHLDQRSTAGYAHLNTAPVIAASGRVGKHLEKVLSGGTVKRRKTPGRPRKTATPKPPPSIYDLYLRSKLKLDDWCREQGLDADTFSEGLGKWRQQQRQQMTNAAEGTSK
jgi:integrase